MALASHASTAVVVSLVATLSGIGPLLAQETQTAPRSPMSPGSAKILMAPTDRDRVLWGTRSTSYRAASNCVQSADAVTRPERA